MLKRIKGLAKKRKENELISYAIDFVSYLILKNKNIEKVILYGSVARGDFDEESDIDLFVESNEKSEEKIRKIIDDYSETKKFKEWSLKGVERDISVIVGKLDSEEWKDLKRSIINTGILLFGKYKADIDKINQYVLFNFENIKPDKKRILVYRKLFGFKIGKKQYAGLIDKIKGIKIGKGSILVPIEYTNELKQYFQDKKIKVRLYDFWSDSKINS